MGNNLEKVFHDDEYEVTLRIRKRDRGAASNAAAADAAVAAVVAAGATNGNGEEEATPAAAATNGKVRKGGDDGSARPRKILKAGVFEEANSSDSEQAAAEATPRSGRYAGRKTSCMKWGDGGLDMIVLKSHLSPNFHVTVPPEFIDLHGNFFEITNGQRCKNLEIEAINKTRFKFRKQHWAAIVHEHNLQLNDTIFFRLESKGKFRVEKGPPIVQFSQAEPSASPPPLPITGRAVEMCSPGVADSAGAGTSGAETAAATAATATPAAPVATASAATPSVVTGTGFTMQT